MKVKVEQTIDDQRLQDLLCNALEGGSNYWYMIEAYNYPDGKNHETLKLEFPHIELPFKGGSLTISSLEEEDKAKAILDYEACIKGIRIMARKYPCHFADFINENDDANTGDVFLQCALYGDVIYC